MACRWDNHNGIFIRLNLAEYDPSIGNGSLIIMATGILRENIKEKDKVENGIIGVDNKY